MKKFIFSLIFVLLVPVLLFPQTEQQQKMNFRSQNNTSNSTTTNPSVSSKVTNTETTQKIEFRNSEQKSNTTTSTNFLPRTPYYVNRWNRWGAPSFYSYYDPFFYTNSFGLRTPARIYYQRDGRRDTIFGKKNNFRLGINLSTKNQIGAWMTIGRNVYFKSSLHKTISSDQSQFYSNITMDVVQSWVQSNPSQNYQLDNIVEGWALYLGVGKEIKNFGVNLSLGIGREKNNFQYFDGTYILSNNGKYSFKNFVDNYTSMSVGVTHDYKFLSIMADYDPFRKAFFLGAGINF